jgi:hypothetical protein
VSSTGVLPKPSLSLYGDSYSSGHSKCGGTLSSIIAYLLGENITMLSYIGANVQISLGFTVMISPPMSTEADRLFRSYDSIYPCAPDSVWVPTIYTGPVRARGRVVSISCSERSDRSYFDGSASTKLDLLDTSTTVAFVLYS